MDKEIITVALTLSPEAQYELRKQIIRLAKKGMKTAKIAEILGVSKSHVTHTKQKYRENGAEGLTPKTCGRKQGEKRLLSPEQEEEIQSIIIDKTPDQLQFKECMWNTRNIRELVQSKYGIDIQRSTLSYYLRRWGFSVQRPKKRAYNQDEKKVSEWGENTYPEIKERAKIENAEIFFGDETGIQNTSNYARGYAPVGRTPIVKTESRHFKINMLSAISTRGLLRFTLYRDTMNSDKLIDFMSRLIHDCRKKVFLILDNLKVHHSKKVTAWLAKYKNEIELFYLPPYAPEYNPDEYLNGDLKRAIGMLPSPRSNDELEHFVRSHLKRVQLSPHKVKSFFASKNTIYTLL